MAKGVKLVSITYGMFNNPNNRKIEKTIEKWMKKGYVLQDRKERPKDGVLNTVLSMGWARGKTELTFIHRDLLNR